MEAYFSGVITIRNPSREVKDWCDSHLTIGNPMYEKLKKLGKEDQIRRCHVRPTMRLHSVRSDGSYVMPGGCIYGIYPLLKGNADIIPLYCDSPDISIKGKPCPIQLYDYQEEAVQAILKAKGGVVQSGCGSGKTTIGIEAVHRIGKRFLWICPTRDLLNQAIGDFRRLYPGIDIGTITDGEVKMGRDGTVSTVQTLSKIDRSIWESEFPVVVVDECHRAGADATNWRMYQTALASCRARYRIGLSATPFRSDGTTDTIFMLLGMSPDGRFAPTFTVSRDRIRTMDAEVEYLDYQGEFDYDSLGPDGTMDYAGLIDSLCGDARRTSAIADRVTELVGEGRKVAILTLRVSHCQALSEEISARGVRTALITGSVKDRERKRMLGDPGSWDAIVATTSLFKEGIDIKSLDAVVMAAPVKDRSTVVQSCGRCERVMEGKAQPLFIIVRDLAYPYCMGAARKMAGHIRKRE